MDPSKPPDPPHDRVTLTADELAALASFERSMSDDRVGGNRGDWARARLADHARILSRLAARFILLSPSLTLLGLLTLPAAIARSDAAGQACALFITVALTTWSVTPRGRWTRWLAKQAARAEQADRRRAKGHPR
jgi:hypothetical protein